MRKIILFFLISQLMGTAFVFAADEEENHELGIEMKGAAKPTLQEAGVKAQEKLNKYKKAKEEVIEIFDPSADKDDRTGSREGGLE